MLFGTKKLKEIVHKAYKSSKFSPAALSNRNRRDKEHCKDYKCLKMSFTNKACINIGGTTYHRGLSLNKRLDITPSKFKTIEDNLYAKRNGKEFIMTMPGLLGWQTPPAGSHYSIMLNEVCKS